MGNVAYSAPSLLSRNYALAGYDRPNVFQMAFLYELPYKTVGGSGNKAMRAVFGDWQVNGIYTAASGTPFTITASGADLNMPGGNMQTANLNGSYNVIGDKGDAGFYFDPTAFSQPTGTSLGNTGRNQFRGPGYWNVDASLFRAFPIGAAGKRVEFRVEAFNLFNHPKWVNPDADLNSATFGRTLTVADGGGRVQTIRAPATLEAANVRYDWESGSSFETVAGPRVVESGCAAPLVRARTRLTRRRDAGAPIRSPPARPKARRRCRRAASTLPPRSTLS